MALKSIIIKAKIKDNQVIFLVIFYEHTRYQVKNGIRE